MSGLAPSFLIITLISEVGSSKSPNQRLFVMHVFTHEGSSP